MRLRAEVGLLALLVVGCGDSKHGTPALSFASSSTTFPDAVIDRAGTETSIALTNTGNEPLTPMLVLASDDFAIDRTTCTSLAAGASCEIVVHFAPHTLGARTADLVASVDGAAVTSKLVGVALPEPGLTATPAAASYADVEVGTSKSVEIVVRNDSAVPARPFATALGGSTDFAIVSDECSGASLPAGGACAIDVTFTPSTTMPLRAQLVVTSANLGSLMIALDGNGFTAAKLAVSPDAGVFGPLYQYQNSAPLPFTVTNTGSVPTPALQLALTGLDAPSFVMTDGCTGSVLAGGASCMFTIVYEPRVAGSQRATVTVAAGTLDPLQVQLTGTGEPAQLQLTPPGYNFGSVLVGQTTAAQTFTLQNTGTANTGALSVALASPNPAFTFVDDTCTGVDLAPAATCSFGVTASALTRGGTNAGIVVRAPRGDTLVASLLVQGIIPATLTATPAGAAFGDIQLTESASQLIRVQNLGDLSTGTIAVAVTGADRADVTLADGCSGLSLASYSPCTLTVTLAPSHLGPENASIELTSPGASTTIAVTANGLPEPLFTVSPSSLVLNPVAVGSSYPQTFVVQGTGATTGPLGVAVTTPSDYAITDDACSGQTIASGQTCTVTVTLTPTATGTRTATLSIIASPGGYRHVPLTAITFTPAMLTIAPSSVSFAATGTGQTDTYGFLTITNAGQLPTGALAVQLTGPAPGQFGVIADTCNGTVLAPGAQCNVHTEFAPTALGPSAATLVVSGSPGGAVSTALSGTGLAPPQISSPISSYDFPAQETFVDRGVQIEIDNIGGSPTDRLHATLTGPQAAEFRAADDSCVNIAAGSRCDVFVEFDPTEVGQASATLTVESALAGTVTVALTGTATPGTSVQVSPAAYDYGVLAVGAQSGAQTFTATNIGQRDVTTFHVFLNNLGCDNFTLVSTTCGSTLAPDATCTADVVFHPVMPAYSPCRLVFVEDTLVKGEADLSGEPSS